MKSHSFLTKVLLCCFFACPLFAETAAIHTEGSLWKISDRIDLNDLRQGSRIIYELPQSIIAITVIKKDAAEVSLEVVTATKDVLDRENISSWLAWCHAGMPSASFHDILTLSLPDGKLKESSPSFHNEWLLTLLSLDMEKVPQFLRKRAGPTPMAGERDLRPVWQPRVIVQGKRLDTPSTAYSVHWPEDNSPLAKREIILYFPQSKEAVNSLPCWIESPSSQYKVFAVDSEKASSP